MHCPRVSVSGAFQPLAVFALPPELAPVTLLPACCAWIVSRRVCLCSVRAWCAQGQGARSKDLQVGTGMLARARVGSCVLVLGAWIVGVVVVVVGIPRALCDVRAMCVRR